MGRSTRGVVAAAVLVLGCSPEEEGPAATEPPTSPAETTAVPAADGRREFVYATMADDVELDVYRPADPTGAPVVVVVHGGGGSRRSDQMVGTAEALVDRGAVAILPFVRLGADPTSLTDGRGQGLRDSTELVGCALRFAAEHARSIGASERIVLVGVSGGGLVGLLTVLIADDLAAAWDEFELADEPSRVVTCRSSDELPDVDHFVGVNAAAFVFDPRSTFHDAEVWSMVDPRAHVPERLETELSFVLGGRDGATPAWHRDEVEAFASELATADLVHLTELGHDLPLDDGVLADVIDIVIGEPPG